MFALISGHPPFFVLNKKSIFYFILFFILILIIISSEFREVNTSLLYTGLHDGHMCPDVEGPLIRSKLKKKITYKKFVKRTVR